MKLRKMTSAGMAAEESGICLLCGKQLPSEPAFVIDRAPASAQDIPETKEAAEERATELELKRCVSCGLWQMDVEPVAYYRDVIRAVGLSETMKELRRRDYEYMIGKYNLAGCKFLECGCGHGEFLQVLREYPVRVFGMEHDPAAAKEAAERLSRDTLDSVYEALNYGQCTVYEAFAENRETKLADAPFDCFLSFNFLEHQPDPAGMLGCMFENLRRGGYGLITVPSFEYIMEGKRYYELISDHIACYTLDSLKKLCFDAGFEVLEEGRIGIGDTLRVVVKKPSKGKAQQILSDEELMRRFESEDTRLEEAETVIEDLEEGFDDISLKIADYLEELSEEGRTLALWGAGHQGFTVAASTRLSEEAVFMVDSSPMKQGRFVPGCGLPIVSPEYLAEHPVDVIMISAPGYIREIEACIRRDFVGKAQFEKLRISDILSLIER